MTSKNTKLEEDVMSEINSGRVKLRSRYIFLAEKLGLGSAFILSVLLAVLFFNLVLFYLRASDNIGYLSFGNYGLLAFLDSFPYLLVVVVVLMVFLAGWIIKKSEFAYKKPFGYLALGLVVTVIFAGGILAFTNVAEIIERTSYDQTRMGMILSQFLHHGLGERHGGVAGQVVEIGDGFLMIQTPRSIKKVDISKINNLDQSIATGTFVMVVGDSDDSAFQATRLRVLNEQEFQMIRSGVHHFGARPIRFIKN